jgi:hypothetical protein
MSANSTCFDSVGAPAAVVSAVVPSSAVSVAGPPQATKLAARSNPKRSLYIVGDFVEEIIKRNIQMSGQAIWQEGMRRMDVKAVGFRYQSK